MGRLDVRIVEAKNLPNPQSVGMVDPYVSVCLDHNTHKTAVIENKTSPSWNEVFKFVVADADSAQLKFEVWNSNVTSDDFLGCYNMNLSGLVQGEVKDEWVLLNQCKSNAELHVRILAVDFGAPPPLQQAPSFAPPQEQQQPPMMQPVPVMQPPMQQPPMQQPPMQQPPPQQFAEGIPPQQHNGGGYMQQQPPLPPPAPPAQQQAPGGYNLEVTLNVYELIMAENKAAQVGKDALDIIGLGVHHTGVEVCGEEISFGMDPSGRNDPSTEGVFCVQPRRAVGNFKEAIPLGVVNLSPQQVQQVVETLKPQWRASSYHMLSRNCNDFTKAFVEALDPSLLQRYPSGVNRIAGAGSVVVPDLLLRKITDAMSPPSACAPELINKIHLPYQPPAPPPLPPQTKAPKAAAAPGPLSGFFGVVKAVVKTPLAVVGGVVGGLVDDEDRKSMVKHWPEIPPSELLDVYKIEVTHINRCQAAKFYVLRQGFGFQGPNGLKLQVGYRNVVSMQYAVTSKNEGNALQTPTFDLAQDPAQADAILLFLDGGAMIPVFCIGSTWGRAGGFVVGNSPTQKLMILLDSHWRKVAFGQ